MPLRATAPEDVTPRLKTFLFGGPSAGKTTAALAFKKAYVIDTEKGTVHYAKQIREAGSKVFHTTSLDEIIEEVRGLLTERHDFHTLIIDPITVPWNEEIDRAEKKVGSEFGRHIAEAGKKMKRLVNLVMQLDLNVLMTAHSRTEYGAKLEKLGETFDGFKKLDYIFDLVVELRKERKSGRRSATIVKSRFPQQFPDGEQFEWSYDALADRYGRDVLEREALPVDMASREQVMRMLGLLDVVRLPDGMVEKWFSKAKVEAWEDMPADVIAKCIDFTAARVPANGERRIEPVDAA